MRLRFSMKILLLVPLLIGVGISTTTPTYTVTRNGAGQYVVEVKSLIPFWQWDTGYTSMSEADLENASRLVQPERPKRVMVWTTFGKREAVER